MPTSAHRIEALHPYAFAEVDRIVNKFRRKGIKPIDFGVGDPLDQTPRFILDAEKSALDKHAGSGYPSYIGMSSYRKKIAEWTKKRFNVTLDPETEITSTIGSKEGIFHFPLGYINQGDYVIMPSPGYPPYKTGTLFTGGIPYHYPLLEKNDFFPDLKAIPQKILKKAKILWLNYPNSPSGKLATPDFYKRAIEFAGHHDLIIASDECYSEIYFDEKPHSILEFGRKNIIVFQSLSKRSCMTGHRIGWACGDRAIIKTFKKIKTNIDSGTPNAIQKGAIAALSDETHVREMNKKYRQKRDIMLEALQKAGLETRTPESTFFIWQRVPEGETSVSFAKRLLHPDIAIVVTPGEWISDKCEMPDRENLNPGQNFIRFALVPTLDLVEKAAERLKNI